jgi:hypothetical protein
VPELALVALLTAAIWFFFGFIPAGIALIVMAIVLSF